MKNAFILIEMIIVLVIISLLLGVGLAYYNNYNEEKKLQTETQKLSDVLHLAFTKTLSGDQSPDPDCTDFSGYRIEFPDTTSYQYVFCCSLACTGGARIVVQSYDLPAGIELVSPSTVIFEPVTGMAQSEVSLTIKNTFLDKCFDITVQNSGLIQDSVNDTCS